MSEAVEDCAVHLGLGAGVTAELHDTGPGTSLSTTCKHPRHCATMVLDTGLPAAPFVGGVLHVGDKPWVSCGAGSYAAWHANAEHHVTELVSGHRVVAMYNLLHAEPVLPDAVARPLVAVAPPPSERTSDGEKKEVTTLMQHLRDNAAKYAESFSSADLASAEELFAKYSVDRGQGDANWNDAAPDEAPAWSARCEAPWKPRKSRAQEFVGFWLMRQYPSREGLVRRAKLNGADADLVAAVAQEFGVPLAHVECRVVYRYKNGLSARNGEASDLHADFVEGADDYLDELNIIKELSALVDSLHRLNTFVPIGARGVQRSVSPSVLGVHEQQSNGWDRVNENASFGDRPLVTFVVPPGEDVLVSPPPELTPEQEAQAQHVQSLLDAIKSPHASFLPPASREVSSAPVSRSPQPHLLANVSTSSPTIARSLMNSSLASPAKRALNKSISASPRGSPLSVNGALSRRSQQSAAFRPSVGFNRI